MLGHVLQLFPEKAHPNVYFIIYVYSVGDKECDSAANRHYIKIKNEKIISKVSEPKLMRICHLNPGMVRGLW